MLVNPYPPLSRNELSEPLQNEGQTTWVAIAATAPVQTLIIICVPSENEFLYGTAL